jgi:hypothetical protein
LDGTKIIPTIILILVRTSTLFCLVGFNETQFMELVIELLVQQVTFGNWPTCDGNLHLKSMIEWHMHLEHQKNHLK